MIRNQQIPANTPLCLLLYKLSMMVAVLTCIGIAAHGNILRICAEWSVDLNPDELECERNEGPTPVYDLQPGSLPNLQ